MDKLKSQFETSLKQKLQQRCSAHISEQTYLLKAFRFFDLDNSASVSQQEWKRAIEKIGVVLENQEQARDLFRIYDQDQSGSLDYQEFVALVFGDQSGVRKRLSPQKALNPAQQQQAQQVFQQIRNKLVLRGTRGMIGLSRQFRIADDEQQGQLDYSEFSKAVRDYRLEITQTQLLKVCEFLDRNRTGRVNYEEFVREVRGPMIPLRRGLVAQAFRTLDSGSGEVDIQTLKSQFSPEGHPDLRLGKTEDEVLSEFLDTFELHHGIFGRGRMVSYQEFEDYYSSVSACIDNDQYFQTMMTNSWTSNSPVYLNKPVKQNRPSQVEQILLKFRQKLVSRGARGIIGLSRQFKIMDDDNSHTLSLGEFLNACHDFRVDITEQEIQVLFRAIDRDRNGIIDYDELLRAIRGPMNSFRTQLANQAWNKLDRDNNGVLNIKDIKGVYSVKSHPDVISGKKSEQEVLGEFLQTFQMHHSLQQTDQIVTKQEFLQYYNNVSASIDDDVYFEVMMTNAWKLRGQPLSRQAWAGEFGTPDHRTSWLADHHRSLLHGSVTASAPFGTSQDPIDYSTELRPHKRDQELFYYNDSQPAAGVTSWTAASVSSIPSTPPPTEILKAFKQKLAQRGARGLIGLARQFKIIDDNNNKSLEFSQFYSGLRDLRIQVNQTDARKLFQYFDPDRSGSVNYQEFIHRIRGELNQTRKQLVSQAFRKLDRTGDGVVSIQDIKGVYNASLHPDVRMGKKTQDDILCEFLDTFEVHHAIFKDGNRNAEVTLQEFLEYYSHISASIDDDRYFELMIRNAWNFENVKYGKGWTGEV